MHDLIKRKSGGQPGNRNAFKHGFYVKALTSSEKRELKNACRVDGLDQEIAILRIKFRSLLTQDGQNLRLINQTAVTLAKLYAIKYNFSKTDNDQLKDAVTTVLEEFAIPYPQEPDTLPVSQTGGQVPGPQI